MSISQSKILVTLLVVTFTQSPAQTAPESTPPIQLTAQQDHQRLLDLLHIDALRPGVSPSKSSTNLPNYDESKANPWPTLPDPLKLANGKPVSTAKVWNTQRRPELLELFSHEYLGEVPANVPKMTWTIAFEEYEDVGEIPTHTKHLIGHADNSAYPALNVNMEVALTLPVKVTGPVPVIVEYTFEKYPQPPGAKPVVSPNPVHPTWKEQVLARGWGYALIYPTTLQADNGAGLTSGIIGLTNHGQPRAVDDWGCLRAWAWGGSRLLDYLATDPQVDIHRMAVEGHSRFGKTALVAMAFEPRWAVGYISSSGAGGASLARHRFGEELENIAASGEYHWMGARYMRYAEAAPQNITPNDLPVDTHELIALCAPRPVFIGGGVTDGDGWADTRGAFLAEVAAGPVYRLLGKKDLGTSAFPSVDTLIAMGDLAFRQQNGGHTPLPNFPFFLDFAARYFSPQW